MGERGLPVCEAWFEAERVDDDLFLITEPHTGPLISANIWLLLGADADLMVDTGNGLAPLLPFVEHLRSLRFLPVEVVHAGRGPSSGRTTLVARCDDYLPMRGGSS